MLVVMFSLGSLKYSVRGFNSEYKEMFQDNSEQLRLLNIY